MDHDFRRYRRGELYYANLNPTVGCEQGGNRPVLLVQNDVGNHYAPTVIAIPVSRQVDKKPELPTHVVLHNVPGLDAPSLFMAEQLRTLDKHRLDNYIGRLDARQMEKINKALRDSLELEEHRSPRKPCGSPHTLLLCLCSKCRRQFFDAGQYRVERADPRQREKDFCTYCQTRMGYDYYVAREKEGDAHGKVSNSRTAAGS